MIFTNTSFINRIVSDAASKAISTPELISNEILNFRTSKKFRQMLDGVRYYEGNHDILQKRRTIIGESGKKEAVDNLPNSRQIDNQYRKMVKQKTNYLVGKPLSVQTDHEQYQAALTPFFGKKFMRQLKNVTKDSLNCGIGWLHPYYNDQGEFCLKRFRPFELIPGWADVDHTQLEYTIRFYDVEVYNGKREETLTKVEFYTLDGVEYFEYHNGVLIPCAPYHQNSFNIGNAAYNWQRLPFIPFKYNDEELPLIVNCKSLQDGLNTIVSNFQDNMEEDMRNTILILVNYDGQNLGEFRRNLSTYGAVKVRNDSQGAGGDVKALQVEVNSENYKAIISIFKKAIVENCMGYDAKDEKLSGTPNQMNIQSMYNDIDLDASDMETEYQAALEELLWFVNMHLINTGAGNFDNETVEFVFNTDMPMDESATIQNIQNSEGIISDETLVANHPWVTDPEKELERLKKQQEENLDGFGFTPQSPNKPGGDPVNGES